MTEQDKQEAIEIMRKLVKSLASFEDETLDVWVETAAMFVCSDKFGENFSRALALYTLHLMFLDGAFKETTDIEEYSRRVASFSLSGEFSQTFATTTADTSGNSLRGTPWGKMYEMLNKKMGGGFGLITAPRKPYPRWGC